MFKKFKLALFFLSVIAFNASASLLNPEEQKIIYLKLAPLPITRNLLWAYLYPQNKGQLLSVDFQTELEYILKSSLIEGDTDVKLLTYDLRRALNLERSVAAFHKQGPMLFRIIPSRSGNFQGLKQNDTIRILTHPTLFAHAHNIFVTDEEVSRDLNPLSLLIHELSHAAFDQWIAKTPLKVGTVLYTLLKKESVEKLFERARDGIVGIDGDLYDLLSERYAFEFEYRLNREFTKVSARWPFGFSYTEVATEQFPLLIDDYVRRHYDIDHPALLVMKLFRLDHLIY